MKKNNILIIALFGLLAVSCHKHEEDVTATINLIDPVENDTIAFGQELHMHGTVIGSDELHGYSLTLTNLDNQTILFNASATTHEKSYAFDEHWVNTVTDTANMEVQVEVELDHEGNKTSKKVKLVALP
jgi:hypothetical protein